MQDYLKVYMEELKEKFLSALERDPSLLNIKWAELEKMFGIPSTGRPGDRARKWYKRYDKCEAPVEDCCEIPSGMKVTSLWQVQGKGGQVKWMRSLKPASGPSQEDRDQLVQDLAKFSPKRLKTAFKAKSGDKFMLELALPDFHIGRRDIKEAEKVFMTALEDLLTEATTNYQIDQILFPVGNDWLNTDTLRYTTTKGTDQFDVAPWSETFRYGWQILASAIDRCAEIAPVHVTVVQGNHDKGRMFYIGDVLSAYFRNDKNVTVDNEDAPFRFYRYGEVLLMFDHGQLRSRNYPLIMADERKDDWAKSTYREVHVGHIHQERVLNEDRGVKVRYLPSMVHENDYERREGYRHMRVAQGLVWSRNTGLKSILHYNDTDKSLH